MALPLGCRRRSSEGIEDLALVVSNEITAFPCLDPKKSSSKLALAAMRKRTFPSKLRLRIVLTCGV